MEKGILNSRGHVRSSWLFVLLNVSGQSESVLRPCSNAGWTLLLSSKPDLNTATNGVSGVKVTDSGRVY